MVNTGKPSGGCKLCRARRIKCDEGKPFCLRCKKSKRQCPGYRDPFEAKIRDETQATIKKFHQSLASEDINTSTTGDEEGLPRDIYGSSSKRPDGRRKPKRPSQPTAPKIGRYGEDNMYSAAERFMNGFTAGLFLPVEQQATCFFMADFVLIPRTDQGRGWHRFVFSLMKRPHVATCLSSAFRAVSFAALARRPNCRPLQVDAQIFYAKALREVQAALQNPAQMKDDQTLAAVLLLAFYESLSDTWGGLDEYISHMRGAAHLIRVRGERQRETPEGHEMFALVRNQMLSLRQLPGGAAVEAAQREDYAWLLQQSCTQRHVTDVAQVGLAGADIRQQTDKLVRERQRDGPGPRNTDALIRMLRTAQVLSARLNKLDQPVSAEWAVDTEQPSDTSALGSAAFPGCPVYKFANLYAGLVYLAAWTSHLYLTTSIFRMMAALMGPEDYKTGAEYDEVVKVAQHRIEDIVSSVPYFLDWKGKDMVMSSFPCGTVDDDGPMKGSVGVNVQWPIYVASVSDFATPEQRAYLRGRLKYLAEVAMIKQAASLYAMDRIATPSGVIEQDRKYWGSPSKASAATWKDDMSPTSVSSFMT